MLYAPLGRGTSGRGTAVLNLGLVALSHGLVDTARSVIWNDGLGANWKGDLDVIWNDGLGANWNGDLDVIWNNGLGANWNSGLDVIWNDGLGASWNGGLG